MINPDNGILFMAKKKWAVNSWKDTEEPEMNISKQKKPN
jgi:hypothetical protein